MLVTISFVILSYLCGSIPFGLLIAKFVNNSDIRKTGSGNIGATNVTRSLGKKWGVITFLLDGLKALVPLYLAKYVFQIENNNLLGMYAVLTVIGHIFPVWLHFKGGKGVATAFCAVAFLDIHLGFVYAVIWLFFYKNFGIVSLASIVAVISGAIYEFLLFDDYYLMALIIALLVTYKHAENIKRILAGKEDQVKSSKS